MSRESAKDEDEGGEAAGCAVLLIEPLTWWLWAYVATTCWHWFVLPMFPAAPNPSRAQAAGLLVTYRVIRGSASKSTYDDKHGVALLGAVISREIAAPLLGLLIAWIIKRWWL